MRQCGFTIGNTMYVAVFLLLLSPAVWAQAPGGPPPGPPPTGAAPDPTPTSAGQTQPSAGGNPWQDLLTRMMDLMQAAGPPACADCGGQKTDPAGNSPSPVQASQPTNQPRQPPAGPEPQSRPPPPPNTPKQAPIIADCFWEGRYYSPGSDIVRGQHDRWCYVTYCDNTGKIQFWDDYNCPPNSMKPTSGHNEGRGAPSPNSPPGGGPGRAGGAGGPGGPGGSPGAAHKLGCDYQGKFYDTGMEISNHRVGERCYGTYCSHDSKVVNWEDWCTEPTTIAPPTPARGGGGRGAGGAAGPGNKRQGGAGGRGGGGGRGGRGGGAAGRRGGGAGGRGGGAGGRGGGAAGRGGGAGGRGGGAGGRGGGAGGRGGGAGGRGGNRRGGNNRLQGCYHNGMYYQPNEDVIVGNIGDLCYGYYCEGSNTFVHWEDQCANNPSASAAQPATAATQPTTGFFFK